MMFDLTLATKDFVQALKTIKPRLRSQITNAVSLDVSFIGGDAVFCIGGAMTQCPAKGDWPGIAAIPPHTLFSFTKVPPTSEQVVFTCDGEKLKIGSFSCKVNWTTVPEGFAKIRNQIHLNELDKKVELKKHYCPNCGTKTGIPQPDTATDLFDGLNTEPKPITRYQCSKCRLGWQELYENHPKDAQNVIS